MPFYTVLSVQPTSAMCGVLQESGSAAIAAGLSSAARHEAKAVPVKSERNVIGSVSLFEFSSHRTRSTFGRFLPVGLFVTDPGKYEICLRLAF